MTPQPSHDPAVFCAAVRGELVGALTLLCGERQVAEELAQEALVRAWQHWSTIAQPRAWTYRCAFNLARSRLRRLKAERRATRRWHAGAAMAATDPDTAVAVAVRAAVAALPQRQRQAIVSRYFADLSVAQTADIMGCAPGTVKALTHQAIASLRAAGLAFEDAGAEVTTGA